MPNLIWFRRDLRVRDNPALTACCQKSQDGVIALFIMTPETWLDHAIGQRQLIFMLNHLKTLSQELSQLNIPLLIRDVPRFIDIPKLFIKLHKEIKIAAVYCNRQYEWDERKRDQQVSDTLKKLGCALHFYDDQVIIPPEKILNQQEQPFKIFTPYKRKWFAMIENYYTQPVSKPKVQIILKYAADPIPNKIEVLQPLPEVGENAALKKLREFCQTSIVAYHKQRDFPALNATSHLSTYLALGILSPKQCFARVLQEQHIHSFSELTSKNGPSVWVSELIWREFYKLIMFYFPEVCRYQPFQQATARLPWCEDKKLFAAWCAGQTGFPLVDAAMRQLNQTGWMHNRLRMLTAMFLSKILFIDWRMGERYFSENLIDLDFSANNGGWQWSASTGTDAVPYFRIFNPTLQSERFDPSGDFIRQYCPELAKLKTKIIHAPSSFIKKEAIDYPQPIVNYQKSREKTLAAFKKIF